MVSIYFVHISSQIRPNTFKKQEYTVIEAGLNLTGRISDEDMEAKGLHLLSMWHSHEEDWLQ